MRKLTVLAVLGFAAMSANAGVTQLTNGQQLTSAQLGSLCSGAGNSCELGDKLFSNFAGNLAAADTNVLIQFGFIGSTYTIQYTDNNGGGFTLAFTETFHVAVDTTKSPLPTTFISSVAAGINDANNNASATFTKTLSNGATGSATCNNVNTVTTCTPVSINSQAFDVSDAYTVSNNGASIIALSNSFTQTTPAATPEPVSMVLFGSGLLVVSLVGRKRLARK